MGRLTRLLKFAGDDANESAKHCIHLTPETDYKNAARLLNNKSGVPHYLLALYKKQIKVLPSAKPGDTSGFRKFYSFLLKCEKFSKSTSWNSLEIQKRFPFLFQSYLVALMIYGTEKDKRLEEILVGNHVYQITILGQ